MNFSKCFNRSDFVQLGRIPSKISSSCKRNRTCRDPFEGDPFKIQSLNFRYADKPLFYPISSRGKRRASADKCQVKSIYYNHDHTISKYDKENLSLRHPRPAIPASNPRKSASVCALANAPQMRLSEKEFSPFIPMPESMNMRDSLESSLHRISFPPATKRIDFKRSKSFITQPTSSSIKEPSASIVTKRNVLKAKNTLDPRGIDRSSTNLNMDHNGSCHITIKFDGIPTSQVNIDKNNTNVQISLSKPKKLKKSKAPMQLSSHEVKPSRSYVIHRDSAPINVSDESHLRVEPSRRDLGGCSTHSMIPHREIKSTVEVLDKIPSAADTIRAYSGVRKTVTPNISRTTIPRQTVSKISIPNRNSESRVQILKKILSNNPVVEPKGAMLFARSKSVLGQSHPSSAMTGRYSFGKGNSRIY